MIAAGNFFLNILLSIDSGIYWLASKSYELLLAITEVQLFGEMGDDANVINEFAERIYILLGIFMLFKVSFSLIKYAVSPDDFTDNNKGIGRLVKNVMICLLLIIAVPYIFQFAQRVQQAVLSENVIPNLILGMGEQDSNTIEYGAEGEEIAFLTFASFFVPNKAIFQDNTDCRKSIFENPVGQGEVRIKQECADIMNQSTGSSYEEVATVYETAFQYRNIAVLTDTDLFKSTIEINGEKVRTFDYKSIVCTIAGGFLAWIFVMFCFDIAVRTVKLAFLQLIAPIPIISYIEPKGKDGVFKKWVNECVKTYLSLFIRLIAIFFAVFIISKIGGGSMVYGERGYDTLVYIFIVFGTLLFAKQLPKLIENIAGIKMDGNFTLNPMNRMRQVPLVGHLASGAAGTLAGGYAGFRAAKELGQRGMWGAWRGAVYGQKEGSRKIGWGGGDGKRVDTFSNASNRAMRELTGHDMAQFSALKYVGRSKAEAEIEKIKDAKKAFGQAVSRETATLNSVQNEKQAAQESIPQFQEQANAASKRADELKEQFLRNPNDENIKAQYMNAVKDKVSNMRAAAAATEKVNRLTAQEIELHDTISKYNRSIEKLSKIQSKREVASGIPEQNIDDLNKLLKEAKSFYTEE